MRQIRSFMVFIFALMLIISFMPVAYAQDAGKININEATAAEIAHLKGIGLKYAERIVQYRKDHGPFASPEDIVKVPGIGPKTLETNKDKITIE